LYLKELQKLQQELASAINNLTFPEEHIIENEVAEIWNQNTTDIMIDATISSVLDNNIWGNCCITQMFAHFTKTTNDLQ
jgi:hypothetical protein